MNRLLGKLQRALPIALAFVIGNLAQQVAADPHPLRPRGRTLVEAENFSAASKQFPYAEDCQECSGRRNLGYFWKNSWFEINVVVPSLINCRVSLRASSIEGTKVEVRLVDGLGISGKQPRAIVDVVKTGGWSDYANSQDVTFALPAGTHTLRFTNLEESAANIDYITFSAGSNGGAIVVKPETNDGPDINPLKGFNSGWWRNEEYASVGFQYIEWGQFEPEDDVFDWSYVEDVLDREGTRGRHVILQFVTDWDYRESAKENYLGPAWLLKKVGEHRGTADATDPNSRQMRATRYNDPAFIEEAKEAIEALLGRYRNDPRTFVIQVGVLGFWGEWHTFPRLDWSPTDATKFEILSAYLNGLGPDALTQVRYPNEPVIEPRRGMGYTNGSATLTSHGHEFGRAINERQLWKFGPVGGEWPPNVDLKHWRMFFLTREGQDFIEAARYSTLLPPEPKEIALKIPGWSEDGLFMKMHRLMGYNFRVNEVRHLVAADDSGRTHIEVKLRNAGIAPFYKNWQVQLAILNSGTSEIVELMEADTDLRTLDPKETVTISVATQAKLDPHHYYQIGMRIVQRKADKSKPRAWNLDARNVYVVLANELKVIEGTWDEHNALSGGWNILGAIERHAPKKTAPIEGNAFPFEGSFRPVASEASQ